jgi:glycosyltransferase involved in cell wall biosynthesis
MRIVMDLYRDTGGRVLNLIRTLAGHVGAHRVIAALPAVHPLPGPIIRRHLEKRLNRNDIHVWHTPGPDRVNHLLHQAFLWDLTPDVVVTSGLDLELTAGSGLPLVDARAIPEHAGPEQALSIMLSRAGPDPAPCLPVHGAVPLSLAMVSPLPPARTGIADYTAVLLPALAEYYAIDVVTDQAEISDAWIRSRCGVRTPDWLMKNAHRYDRIVYHMGNSGFHRYMLDLMKTHPGVVVLHDFFVGNFFRYVDSLAPDTHVWARALYKSHGYKAVRERFHAPDPETVAMAYPCSFPAAGPATGVIVHSRFSAKLAADWYPGLPSGHWHRVPLVRRPPARLEDNQIDVVTQNPVPAGTGFLVCSFGMLGPTKLNHRLLSAWLESGLARDPDCFLVFVGENHPGEYGRDLADTIRKAGTGDRIRITGWVTPEAFTAWLDLADVAVQLRTRSRGETSAAVLDCMNHGLPVIVNAHGASSELPQNAVWMLPDDFTRSDLATALKKLKKDRDLRQRLGRQAARTIADHHSPDVCARHYAQTIETAYRRYRYRPRGLIPSLAALEALPEDPGYLAALARAVAANHPDPVPEKRLFIDVSATARNDLKAGIDRVSRSLVLALIEDPPPGFRAEPVLLTETRGTWAYCYARRYTLDLLDCPDIRKSDEMVEMQAGDRLFCPDLTGDLLVKAWKTGLFETIRHTGVTLVFTVFDLLPLLRPDTFPPGADGPFHDWLSAVCRTANQVVCISRSVARELETWYETDPVFFCLPMPEINWFHLGADLDASAPTRGLPAGAGNILERMGAGPSFLMVGTIEPRKGHLQVLAAFDRLWARGLDVFLVIAGKPGWSHLPDDQRRTIPDIIQALDSHPEKNRRLFFLKEVSDQFLDQVYDAARCLLAASEAEGFGLPLIEAAQHGLPVMARDIPVFREVAGDHAFYFDGTDPDHLADAIRHWLDLYRQNRHPRSDAMPWLTWRHSCDRLKQLIQG